MIQHVLYNTDTGSTETVLVVADVDTWFRKHRSFANRNFSCRTEISVLGVDSEDDVPQTTLAWLSSDNVCTVRLLLLSSRLSSTKWLERTLRFSRGTESYSFESLGACIVCTYVVSDRVHPRPQTVPIPWKGAREEFYIDFEKDNKFHGLLAVCASECDSPDTFSLLSQAAKTSMKPMGRATRPPSRRVSVALRPGDAFLGGWPKARMCVYAEMAKSSRVPSRLC